jgi:hypothetical protein
MSYSHHFAGHGSTSMKNSFSCSYCLQLYYILFSNLSLSIVDLVVEKCLLPLLVAIYKSSLM